MNKGVDGAKLVLQRVGRQTPHSVKDLDMAVHDKCSEVAAFNMTTYTESTSERKLYAISAIHEINEEGDRQILSG